MIWFRLTEEQKVLIKEFALLERNTPGTIDGLADIEREKNESRESDPQKAGRRQQETDKQETDKQEEKQKPGILSRIKNAIFG